MRSSSSSREFKFTNRDFRWVTSEIHSRAGISLSDAKRDLVYNRLSRRLRALGMKSVADYREFIELGDENEATEFVNAITTNVTSFFREDHHFDFLSRTGLPEIIKRNQASRRARIWSAGCSSGEEPYSIAMTLLESGAALEDWDIRVLATDIDTKVVDRARQGVYALDRADPIGKARLRRWFHRGSGDNAGKVRAVDPLRNMITFRQLNLMSSWPMGGPFDVIFCRNVMIYFDKETQSRLLDRYADLLSDGGYLIIGHSESTGPTKRFELVGRTIYRKLG
jgi:chemotaxis protein methyltransferase CheR